MGKAEISVFISSDRINKNEKADDTIVGFFIMRTATSMRSRFRKNIQHEHAGHDEPDADQRRRVERLFE